MKRLKKYNLLMAKLTIEAVINKQIDPADIDFESLLELINILIDIDKILNKN